MGSLLKLLPWILGCIESIQKWLDKRKRVSEINKVNKAVDTDNDKLLAHELRKLAEEVENRRKIS